MSTKCGGPKCEGRQIAVGQPMQVIRPNPEHGTREFYRCVLCAEGIPPADLPPLVSKQIPIAPMVHITSGPGTLPLDFKTERQPGEDG